MIAPIGTAVFHDAPSRRARLHIHHRHDGPLGKVRCAGRSPHWGLCCRSDGRCPGRPARAAIVVSPGSTGARRRRAGRRGVEHSRGRQRRRVVVGGLRRRRRLRLHSIVGFRRRRRGPSLRPLRSAAAPASVRPSRRATRTGEVVLATEPTSGKRRPLRSSILTPRRGRRSSRRATRRTPPRERRLSRAPQRRCDAARRE
jgi:hypothetical protein